MQSYFELKISTSEIKNFKNLFKSINLESLKLNFSLPKKYKRFVVIKSPHVNKKSKEHFQILKHTCLFILCSSSTELKTFLLNTSNNLWIRIKRIEKQNI